VIVTFLSDYGPGDEYAGIVVGVIARMAAERFGGVEEASARAPVSSTSWRSTDSATW
jgi:hypothetical protein